MQVQAYAVDGPTSSFKQTTIPRRKVGERDILIDILYCGVCHTDIHYARNEWGLSHYPMVPGHEIAGKVIQVGSKVTKFKVGDLAGVGCMVDSCKTLTGNSCDSCKINEEQFCKDMKSVYNSKDRNGSHFTYGGYSTQIVVDEHFTLNINNKMESRLAEVAPLLCAGITSYSALSLQLGKNGAGKKVGIIGLGGLGHVAVKIATAMGAEVSVFSSSPSKEQDAKKLGAHHFIVSKDSDAMKAAEKRFDMLLDTVSADHDIEVYMKCLKPRGNITVVAPIKKFEVSALTLIFAGISFTGSSIGGIAETQEMLDFCSDKGIFCDIELIPIQKLAEAFDRTVKADVRYRFVIDMQSLKNSKL